MRFVPESSQSNCRKGQDLNHDEHVEEVSREHKAYNSAGEHQKQSVVLAYVLIETHIGDRVAAGDKNRCGYEQPEEKAQRVNFKRNTDGIASGRFSRAHPVGYHFTVYHDRLYERDQTGKRYRNGAYCKYMPQCLAFSRDYYQKSPQKQDHYGVYGEVCVGKKVCHPFSLLISRVSSVP